MLGSQSQQQSPLEHTIVCDTRNTPPCWAEQYTSTPGTVSSPDRARRETHVDTKRIRGSSVDFYTGSRQYGTVEILNAEIARITRRSSYSPGTTGDRPSSLEKPAIQATRDRVSILRDDTILLGGWRCCKCLRGHAIYRIGEGQHPLSILSCMCPHRTCKNCDFQGGIKRFAPIDGEEGSALMPTAGGSGEDIHMGIVCRVCGLSWQAEKVEAPKRRRSFRRRLSVLPKKVNPMPSLRHARSMVHLGRPRDPLSDGVRPGTSLSTSRSFLNLRSVSDTQKPTLAEQARGVQVRFYGIECTCGSVTDDRSICYTFFGLPKSKRNNEGSRKAGREIVRPEPWYLPTLRSQGYGTPTLHLMGGPHPNPLMGNIVHGLELL